MEIASTVVGDQADQFFISSVALNGGKKGWKRNEDYKGINERPSPVYLEKLL